MGLCLWLYHFLSVKGTDPKRIESINKRYTYIVLTQKSSNWTVFYICPMFWQNDYHGIVSNAISRVFLLGVLLRYYPKLITI
jgi:hypothetical protein